MTTPPKLPLLLLLCAGLVGCEKSALLGGANERLIKAQRVLIATYERREELEKLAANSVETNIVLRLEALATTERNHILICDTNFAILLNGMQQFAARIQGLEQKLAALEPKSPQPAVQQSLPPLLSAPAVPQIEKEKP